MSKSPYNLLGWFAVWNFSARNTSNKSSFTCTSTPCLSNTKYSFKVKYFNSIKSSVSSSLDILMNPTESVTRFSVNSMNFSVLVKFSKLKLVNVLINTILKWLNSDS
ncbi:hypothetical protein WICPIJ_010135 [Wickerhamomyces pijperi]|uniref:Uncharacterized protein n=1 Tax=Wickerhamomyces pijperi TaxID=599730 RepID=A0A9P8TBG8_WICPI|nr:hypothetical protein WICPIJ_010135 [Wickerhamomyces pijperi]